MLAYCQADILRQRCLRDIGERFVRAPTFHIFGHFAAGPRSIVKYVIALIVFPLREFIIDIAIYNVFANNCEIRSQRCKTNNTNAKANITI